MRAADGGPGPGPAGHGRRRTAAAAACFWRCCSSRSTGACRGRSSSGDARAADDRERLDAAGAPAGRAVAPAAPRHVARRSADAVPFFTGRAAFEAAVAGQTRPGAA